MQRLIHAASGADYGNRSLRAPIVAVALKDPSAPDHPIEQGDQKDPGKVKQKSHPGFSGWLSIDG